MLLIYYPPKPEHISNLGLIKYNFTRLNFAKQNFGGLPVSSAIAFKATADYLIHFSNY